MLSICSLWPSKLRSSMHQCACPGHLVAIRRVVAYHARAAHEFSAEFKYRHCTYIRTYKHIYIHTYKLIYTYIHTHIHAYIRTYVRTYIHTHI